MAPMEDPSEADWDKISKALRDLYKGGFLDLDKGVHNVADAAKKAAAMNIVVGPKGYDPSTTIPQILRYLRDNDVGRDVDWPQRFPVMQAYVEDAYRQMKTGELGFDRDLRAAVEDARVMIRVHQVFEKRAKEKTQWTDSILRGRTTQERLLTYPKIFPLPNRDHARSQYRPVKPMPRPGDNTTLWNTTLRILYPDSPSQMTPAGLPSQQSSIARVHELTEVDNYVKSEDSFFYVIQQSAQTGIKDTFNRQNLRFDTELNTYENNMRLGLVETTSRVPPPPNNVPHEPRGPLNPDGSKGVRFYQRRGWQRAALQQALNLFTSHENRVINTPWRRPVLPYEQPVPLPKDIAYVPRVVDPNNVTDERLKDPFSWLNYSSQYSRIIDFLAGAQHRHYKHETWGNFHAPALPNNFRGPRIYKGLSVYDQHWLQIGDYLEKLEGLLHEAWGAAPRPLLRAILRDIDAGRQHNTGGLNTNNNLYLPDEYDVDMHDRKRYWRRDIKRRLGIDNREDNFDDDNYKLVDNFDIAWLRYLCEPSRTLEMCDRSRLPSRNLTILFDAKLQSYFKNLEESGTPDSKALYIWGEDHHDIHEVLMKYKPNTIKKVLAYINGCEESEVLYSGNPDPNPEHPNQCYQFSIEEAEYLCVELENLGRCRFTMGTMGMDDQPSRVDRPRYTVHPEDRVLWRYSDEDNFEANSTDYLDDMLEHYHTIYGNWPMYDPNRPRFSRELEFMMDHLGPDFPPELEREETLDTAPPARRLAYIGKNLVQEGMWHRDVISNTDALEVERDAPYWEDLASWEDIGAYLTDYLKNQMEMKVAQNVYPHDLYQPQTPERTVQFLRNLAYRMGRTMRHVAQIKERLQYLEETPQNWTAKPPLDLSAKLKNPAPTLTESDTPSPPTVKRWWHAISVVDYNLATDRWNRAIERGTGDVALLPPDIQEVLDKADPQSSFRNEHKDKSNPFTIIREGIIDDCARNEPTMYPGRLNAVKDERDKEYQGYERPNLFEWATTEQRRYQAPYTREHFFCMQRWPPSRILPHRLEAIRNRKDEIARKDPSKDDQAYGILTDRLPVGKDKPLYAHPIIQHWHGDHDDDLFGARRPQDIPPRNPDNPPVPPVTNPNLTDPVAKILAAYSDLVKGTNKDKDKDKANKDGDEDIEDEGDKDDEDDEDEDNENDADNMASNGGTTKGLTPYVRPKDQFAPGPAVFPMGDTLLQKILISHELNTALYPELPFFQQKMMGIPKLWQALVGKQTPLIPLVPPVPVSSIPRSNPRKRGMPVEFMNSPTSSSKKFCSGNTVPQQPGGIGGEFAAGTVGEVKKTKKKSKEKGKANPTTMIPPLPTYPVPDKSLSNPLFCKDFPNGWDTLNSEVPDLVQSAIAALHSSINRQLPLKNGVMTNLGELQTVLASAECKPLQLYTDPTKLMFNLHCVSFLLTKFGDSRGHRLQLGIVQEDTDNTEKERHLPSENYPKKFVSYLVGNEYDNYTDKVVVWIRLSYAMGEGFNFSLYNTHSKSHRPYNCYKGIHRNKG